MTKVSRHSRRIFHLHRGILETIALFLESLGNMTLLIALLVLSATSGWLVFGVGAQEYWLHGVLGVSLLGALIQVVRLLSVAARRSIWNEDGPLA